MINIEIGQVRQWTDDEHLIFGGAGDIFVIVSIENKTARYRFVHPSTGIIPCDQGHIIIATKEFICDYSEAITYTSKASPRVAISK